MELSINRLINLIKRDWIIHRKFTLSFILILFLFGGFVMWAATDVDRGGLVLKNIPAEAGMIVFVAMLFVGGILLTLLTFSEFNRDTSRLHYLGLPASNFEKLLTKWLYTMPGYLIIVSLLFAVVYSFFGWIFSSIYNVQFVSMGEIDFRDISYFLLAFLVLHAFCFLMAVVYNRYTIPKTILTALGFIAITILLIGIIFRVVFYDHWEGFFTPSDKQMNVDMSDSFKDWAENMFKKLPYIGAAILVPFLWIVSYFKISEKEA